MNEYERQPQGYDSVPDQPDGEAGQPMSQKAPTHTAPGPIQPTSVFCVQCGYNLTGVAIGASCPECGRTVAPSFHSQMLPSSGKAVASLVLGICSIVGCMIYGIPSLICGPLAIIFASLARKQVREGTVSPSSSGMATAGMTCGIIGTVLALIGVVMLIALIISEL